MSFPIWSCSVRGLACRVCCQPRGGLLPHLFTLPPSTHHRRLAASMVRSGEVCFLCHCPSGRPARVLPGALPCGVRTFLSRRHYVSCETVTRGSDRPAHCGEVCNLRS